MLRIRSAVETDIPALTRLLGQLFGQEAEFRPDDAAQRAGLLLILADPSAGTILVADDNGRLTGMATLLFTVSTVLGGRVALLDDLVVDHAMRGRGTGAALMRGVMDTCRRARVGRISLNSDRDNSAAHRFYERFGFKRSTMIPFRLHL
ncbi:MAG: GNAT family N-acetyltransferase [Alphaproteobacteria bacterium]